MGVRLWIEIGKGGDETKSGQMPGNKRGLYLRIHHVSKRESRRRGLPLQVPSETEKRRGLSSTLWATKDQKHSVAYFRNGERKVCKKGSTS